jgi:hypothetical protein
MEGGNSEEHFRHGRRPLLGPVLTELAMSQAMPAAAGRVPPWVVGAGSLAICLHLGLVGINALAAPSGPWPRQEGPPEFAGPPAFAQAVVQVAEPYYLSPLKLNMNYHFESNRTELPAAYIVAHLKDAQGNVFRTIRLPDPDANPWVRHRQERLAWYLTNDGQPLILQAPNVPPEMFEVFVEKGNHHWQFMSISENDLPRGRPIPRPSQFSFLFANAYARHLCREQEAARVEIVRHTKKAIPPTVAFREPAPPTDFFAEDSHSFGDLPHVQASSRDVRR